MLLSCFSCHIANSYYDADMQDIVGSFPRVRVRRNRRHAWCRDLVSEQSLNVNDLIWPAFVHEGDEDREVESLPGVFRYSIDSLVKKVGEAVSLGIPAIMLFPVVDGDKKTEDAAEAFNQGNLICRAVKAIKEKHGDKIGVICDVALDPYTSHGHDGLIEDGQVHNDKTVDVLCKQSIVLVEAGCDIVAPSDMMDGRIGAIRDAMEDSNYTDVGIISYAAKYASHLYGPFRDAVGSKGNLGGASKETYQMNYHNSDEAMKEIAMDIKEGADMVMIKPGTFYLDIIQRACDAYKVPIFAYQVSGEYAMIKAAADKGLLDWEAAIYENLIAFKRAGASAIVTYAAHEVAKKINDS